MWKDRFEDLLARAIGLDPATVGPGVIRRAFEVRMAAHGLKCAGDYLQLTRESPQELQALIEEVVVPESWFFRDGQPFVLLQAVARDQWLSDKNRPPIRVLSLPCAGGEEPYSIAMALLDVGLSPSRFVIDAVDVSHRCLDKARRGVYSTSAFRGPDQSCRRYFRQSGNLFELNANIKEGVRFICGNLVDPQLLINELPYDFIFFRNLLIYLNASARVQAMATLDRLLNSTGILISGHAESLAVLWPRFMPVSDLATFAYRRITESEERKASEKVSKPRIAPLPLPRPSERRVLPAPPLPKALPMTLARSALENHAPRSSSPRPTESPLLQQAAELANHRRYDEAISLCERSQRESGFTAESFYLLGMIHQASGKPMQAEASFHKTVYLDGLHDEALLALALIAERRGDTVAAAGFRRRAERASQRKGTA